MNKLRLIKIYELRGKVHPIEATIIKLLDGIEEEQQFDRIYYTKYGKYYFVYDIKYNTLYIYTSVLRMLNCSVEEANEIIKYLLEKHLKLKINE